MWESKQRRVFAAQGEDNVDSSDVVVVEVVIQTRLKSKARLEGHTAADSCWTLLPDSGPTPAPSRLSSPTVGRHGRS